MVWSRWYEAAEAVQFFLSWEWLRVTIWSANNALEQLAVRSTDSDRIYV